MVSSKKNRKAFMRSKLKELVFKREQAEQRRIFQNEIAEKTGLTPGTISRWMSPRPIRQIQDDVVIPLCEFFQCDIGDLVTIEYSDD
ncbi:MAG: XRE family transcriptional regulator [Chloroflexi bacterium]|nr:MAG: XRE family transcriptional regulator [Chloroflexota bacterium]